MPRKPKSSGPSGRDRTPRAGATAARSSRPASGSGGPTSQLGVPGSPIMPQGNALNLERSIIALPLLKEMYEGDPPPAHNVIIDAHLDFPGGRDDARRQIIAMIAALIARPGSSGEKLVASKNDFSRQYVFARLKAETIKELIRRDRKTPAKSPSPAIFRVWLDHVVRPFVNKSIVTIKGDAAIKAFNARGSGIVWAVADTGIDSTHPHFELHDNLTLSGPLKHRDFAGEGEDSEAELQRRACTDLQGHGTHVAGIIAGEFIADAKRKIVAEIERRDESNEVHHEEDRRIATISGIAPECKILSLKVLDDDGRGLSSNLIAALEYVHSLNSDGRRILVHGVNLSVGYDFEPKWYACGQSPLCVEVNRLVSSGVAVVVAAGNTGYGFIQSESGGPPSAGLDLTINDPGNAELAITVGSTHRDAPHQYGVSYFSSKGPTGDGRLKPDLVAPGERIVSCKSGSTAAGKKRRSPNALYKEDSGTSMAAPHVSGAIAAFLSIRNEFIGRPLAVKDIFLTTATDLKRTVYFQGKGLIDLMRAIQSV